MAKARNYETMPPWEVIRVLERSKPGKLEIDIESDFVPTLTDVVRAKNIFYFKGLIEAYLSYVTRTQEAKSQSPDEVARAGNYVWALCERLDKKGLEATEMFRKYKPREYHSRIRKKGKV